MNLKQMLDRRLIVMIVSPLARAGLSALTGYLAASGVPASAVDQLAAAVAALGVLGFNIGWELLDRKKSEIAGARRVLEGLDFGGKP